MTKHLNLTIPKLNRLMQAKKITSATLIQEAYSNYLKYNKDINAAITFLPKEKLMTLAQKADQTRTSSSSLLHGLPFIMKDSYVTKDIKTTCASNVLSDFIPPYSATVYQKLSDAGAILVGKMNMDAWGHGGSTENTDFMPTKNPWSLDRVAGGSSGGPAAGLAVGMAAFAIGEDTGGSIRNPAAWTNTTGLKVTYGRVSRYGCIAYASSFDTIGPMARSVIDCAAVLEVIAGNDPYDATTSLTPVPAYLAKLNQSLTGKILGVPEALFSSGLDAEIKTIIYQQLDVLKTLGLKIKPVSMPALAHGLAVYYLIGLSETSSNLSRYDGIRFGQNRTHFTEETMRRIMIGTYALSSGYYDAYYRQAQKGRTLLIQEYNRALKSVDVLLMPVNPTPPPKFGELVSDPLTNLLADIYTVTQNPAGVPSLALPAGFTQSNLPVGMQLVGSLFSEPLLLAIGHQYQLKTTWHQKQPPILA